MADGFGQLDAPLGSVQGALADFHVAQFLARGTRLGLVEQLRLLDSEILHDVTGDGLSDFASGFLDAGKGGLFPSEVEGSQIDADFLGNLFQGLLIFGRPGVSKHAFILELRACEKNVNNARRIPKAVEISY